LFNSVLKEILDSPERKIVKLAEVQNWLIRLLLYLFWRKKKSSQCVLLLLQLNYSYCLINSQICILLI